MDVAASTGHNDIFIWDTVLDNTEKEMRENELIFAALVM